MQNPKVSISRTTSFLSSFTAFSATFSLGAQVLFGLTLGAILMLAVIATVGMESAPSFVLGFTGFTTLFTLAFSARKSSSLFFIAACIGHLFAMNAPADIVPVGISFLVGASILMFVIEGWFAPPAASRTIKRRRVRTVTVHDLRPARVVDETVNMTSAAAYAWVHDPLHPLRQEALLPNFVWREDADAMLAWIKSRTRSEMLAWIQSPDALRWVELWRHNPALALVQLPPSTTSQPFDVIEIDGDDVFSLDCFDLPIDAQLALAAV